MNTLLIRALAVGVVMLGGLSSALAAPCPKCPSGCIPKSFVAELKEPAPTASKVCPVHCVPTEYAKTVRRTADCKADRSVVAKVGVTGSNAASTQSRSIFFATALSNPVGQISITGYALGLWDIVYTPSKNLELGIMVAAPIAVYGVMPHIKAQFQLSKSLSLGFGAQVGIGGFYIFSRPPYFVVYGGHIEATVSMGRHALTFGFQAGSGGDGRPGNNFSHVRSTVMFPNIGYRYEFHPNWSFQAELTAPVGVGESGDIIEQGFSGRLVLLTYGFRGHGKRLFGEVGAMFPFFSDFITDVWMYAPIGIPYFSLGYKW
jgi:hypothetical protein